MKNGFITGASSGLGLGMTTKLLVRGDTVFVKARRTDAIAALPLRHPGRLHGAALGSTAFINIEREPNRRLQKLRRQREIAYSADRP
jgi:NADP-dependent 3-hydroxy acid dehydrogenase YdfG